MTLSRYGLNLISANGGGIVHIYKFIYFLDINSASRINAKNYMAFENSELEGRRRRLNWPDRKGKHRKKKSNGDGLRRQCPIKWKIQNRRMDKIDGFVTGKIKIIFCDHIDTQLVYALPRLSLSHF